MSLLNSMHLCLRAAACSALAAMVVFSPGCDSKKDETAGASGSTTSPTTAAASAAAPAGAEPITIGFLYVGSKQDNGYNQSHADGEAAVAGIPGVSVIDAENVPETIDCDQKMSTMIKTEDAKIIFATSFGYFKPHVLETAPKFPDVAIFHAGGQKKDTDPANIGTYFANIDELEYLCGMAAGATTKTNKIGYVAAKPIKPVQRDINAFELGAKSLNPKATVTVIFTGDWFQPNKEVDAVTTLADQGIDVISGHIDSPKAIIQTAEKRGLYSCGYHYNGASLAPKGYLTGAEWNWGPMYVRFVNEYRATKKLPMNFNGGLKDGSVKLSTFGSAVPADAQAKIMAVKEQMLAGTFKMYTGPLKDNEGNVILKDGESWSDDAWDWGKDYLVDGVIGKVK